MPSPCQSACCVSYSGGHRFRPLLELFRDKVIFFPVPKNILQWSFREMILSVFQRNIQMIGNIFFCFKNYSEAR